MLEQGLLFNLVLMPVLVPVLESKGTRTAKKDRPFLGGGGGEGGGFTKQDPTLRRTRRQIRSRSCNECNNHRHSNDSHHHHDSESIGNAAVNIRANGSNDARRCR